MQEIQKRQSEESSKISSTADCIRKWLVRLAALYNRELSVAVFAIWTEALAAFDVSALEAAFRRIENTFRPTSACPFPVPAHVFELVENVKEAESKRRADDDWNAAYSALSRFYTPDLPQGGLTQVHFSDKVWHSIRAAGGAAVIATCPTADLHFRQSEFVEAWRSYSVLESDANFLPEAQAKKLLAELRNSVQSQLAPKEGARP